MPKNDSSTMNLDRTFHASMVSRRTILRSFTVGLTAVGASVVVGCAAPAAVVPSETPIDGTTTDPAPEALSLELWRPVLSSPYEEIWLEMESRVNAEEGSVQVTFLPLPAQEFSTKLMAASSAGTAPHIVYSSSIRPVYELARNSGESTAQPLDDLMLEAGIDLNDFYENLLDANRFEGKLLGIPLDAQPVGAVINKAHAEEAGLDPNAPPLDGEAFLQWAETLRDNRAQPPFVLDGAGFQTNMVFGILANQFGGTEFMRSNEAPVDVFAQAAEFIQGLYNAELVLEETENPFGKFLENSGSIYWAGSWVLPNVPEDSYVTARVPTIGAQFSTLGAVSTLSILNSENARESAQIIAKLSNLSEGWVSRGPGVPPRQSLAEQVRTKHPFRAPFIDSLPFMDAGLCSWDMYINVESPVRQRMDRVWRRESLLEEQLQELREPNLVGFGPCCEWNLRWCCDVQ